MVKRTQSAVPAERLSASEWQLMRICWRLGRCTVREVLREDLKTRIRDYRTILTFMTRMEKKGWLTVDKEGNTNFYTPAIAQEKALKEEIQRFVDEVVGPEPENRQILEAFLAQGARKR
jgi:BlaI family penicillinase repressor